MIVLSVLSFSCSTSSPHTVAESGLISLIDDVMMSKIDPVRPFTSISITTTRRRVQRAIRTLFILKNLGEGPSIAFIPCTL